MTVGITQHCQWASYQIRKIAGCACAGNAGNVSPRRRLQRKPLVSDPGMHHGTCVTHVPWCMSGSFNCGDGETFPAFPAHAHPQICVSGKRPMWGTELRSDFELTKDMWGCLLWVFWKRGRDISRVQLTSPLLYVWCVTSRDLLSLLSWETRSRKSSGCCTIGIWSNWRKKKTYAQGWFEVCAQPMGDGVTL